MVKSGNVKVGVSIIYTAPDGVVWILKKILSNDLYEKWKYIKGPRMGQVWDCKPSYGFEGWKVIRKQRKHRGKHVR